MENQQIPSESSSLDNFFNISFDEATRAQVRKAAQWARICTLCAFIGYGITLIVTFFGRQTTSFTETEEGIRISSYTRAGSIIGSIISIGIGVLINYFLYRFATATAKGMDAMDSIKANEGFDNLRIYFKILGIILIIVLSILALFLLFSLLRFR